MDTGAAVFLFLACLELSVAALLFTRSGPGLRLLGLLFLVNAAASCVAAAGPAIAPAAAAGLFKLFGTPTGPLILAAALARYHSRRAAATGIALVGVAQGLLWASYPDRIGAGTWDLLLRGIPLYFAYAFLILSAVRTGVAAELWIALAFLPRAVEFGFGPLLRPGEFLWAPVSFEVAASWVARLLLLAIMLGAAWSVWTRASTRFRAPLLSMFFLGVVLATARNGLGEDVPRSTSELVNAFSVAVARSALVPLAFVSASGVAWLAGAALLAALGGTALWILVGDDVGAPASLLAPWLAFGAALVVLAVALPPILARADRVVRRSPALSTSSDPQWQRLVVALRGSSRSAPLRPEWTQRALVEATGVPLQRVSEFADVLNRQAENKLNEFVPDWRRRFGPGVPKLVEKKRGAVPGENGVRVYYRLTAAGDAVADAVDGSQVAAPAAEESGGIRSRG